MEIIQWESKSIKSKIEILVRGVIRDVSLERIEEMKTREAIAVCKMKLMGEYHAILIKTAEDLLMDSEIYLLTWDGEASNGGNMTRLDFITLQKIANETFLKELEESV